MLPHRGMLNDAKFAPSLFFMYVFSMRKGFSERAAIVDSAINFNEAVSGKEIPREIVQKQRLLDVRYISDDGLLHHGQIVVHQEIAPEVLSVFQKCLQVRFPIHAVVPASTFGWSDDELMKRNITSGLNYRTIRNTKRISSHGYGLAFDVSPKWNPCFYTNGDVAPPGASYNPKRPGTLAVDGEVLTHIESLGFTCGIRWREPWDTGHVEARELWLQSLERAE